MIRGRKALIIDAQATPHDTILDLGRVTLTSVDCEIWRLGVPVLDDYHRLLAASPPAGQLRIHRWSAVYVGTEYTYYDYINVPTDWTSEQPAVFDRNTTIFHEFGHTVRHAADGSETHWSCDNFNYAYARYHDGSEITNAQYAFNEGCRRVRASVRANRSCTTRRSLNGTRTSSRISCSQTQSSPVPATLLWYTSSKRIPRRFTACTNSKTSCLHVLVRVRPLQPRSVPLLTQTMDIHAAAMSASFPNPATAVEWVAFRTNVALAGNWTRACVTRSALPATMVWDQYAGVLVLLTIMTTV